MPVDPMRYVMGVETELLTVCNLTTDSNQLSDGAELLFQEIAKIVPTARCAQGIFTPYGRVYLDGPHLELAVAECCSPFTLVSMRYRLEQVVQKACANMREQGHYLILSNCNHSGILNQNSATWGCHGNYLIEDHPSKLGNRLLAFLMSHSYTGAGGVSWPDGQWILSTRMIFMDREQDGDTQGRRALHSTEREEHLNKNPTQYGYRYHTLWQDGCRSHFSQILQAGVTALVLKAVISDPDSVHDLPRGFINPDGNGFWIQAAWLMNCAKRTPETLVIDPLVIKTQRFYLNIVDQYLARYPESPEWTRQVAAIWETTLNKLEQQDTDWLASRLDPWAKQRLFTKYLEDKGAWWDNYQEDENLAAELALLNQSYHLISSNEATFDWLLQQKILQQNVTSLIEPGEEEKPFVPNVKTRAQARARLLGKYAQEGQLTADWEHVMRENSGELFLLKDPCDLSTELVRPAH